MGGQLCIPCRHRKIEYHCLIHVSAEEGMIKIPLIPAFDGAVGGEPVKVVALSGGGSHRYAVFNHVGAFIRIPRTIRIAILQGSERGRFRLQAQFPGLCRIGLKNRHQEHIVGGHGEIKLICPGRRAGIAFQRLPVHVAFGNPFHKTVTGIWGSLDAYIITQVIECISRRNIFHATHLG